MKGGIVEQAKKQRHISLMEKIQEGKPLTKGEIEELAILEDEAREPTEEEVQREGMQELSKEHILRVVDGKISDLMRNKPYGVGVGLDNSLARWAAALKALLDCKAKLDPSWAKSTKEDRVASMLNRVFEKD